MGAHNVDSGDVLTPMDLRGKRIGVEFGSTAHYALMAYYKEFDAKIVTDTTYQRLHQCGVQPEGKLIPCHFENQTDAVTLYNMMPDDIEEAYNRGEIHAAYVGYPHLYRMKQ